MTAASSIDPAEVERFSRIAAEWWDPHGKFAPLHRFNPVRLAFIREQALARFGRDPQARRPFEGLSLLDIGCGGGLLSERFLDQPEPRGGALDTVSLRKYNQMVDAWGGWPLFQELLGALNRIATRHAVSIATVAVRWVLDCPAVAGAILGRRLGLSDHRGDNQRVFALRLDAEDHGLIDAVLLRSRDLFRLIGDCGDEYR